MNAAAPTTAVSSVAAAVMTPDNEVQNEPLFARAGGSLMQTSGNCLRSSPPEFCHVDFSMLAAPQR
jgi:hypothetical protein